jgi:indole-3-glycerol phosphate synthase
MNILEQIHKTKLIELNKLKAGQSRFYKAILDSKLKPALIAEIKRASPSEGIICKNFDPINIAEIYKKSGAAAISVLTDRNYFKGNIELIKQIKTQSKLPILRKDFIYDEYQIYESKLAGADAVLFIMSFFEIAGISIEKIKTLYELAKNIGLDVLVEVHNKAEIDAALYIEPEILGINVRDLKDFSIDLHRFDELSTYLKSRVMDKSDFPLIVAESGIASHEDIEYVKRNANAVLIGSTLMKSKDISCKIKELYTQK